MKIHIISNSIRMNSGFSVVAKNLAIGLKKLGHDITFTGMQTAYLSEWDSDIEVLPIQTYYVDDITQSMITIGKIKPDIVLAIFQMDNQFNDFAKIFPKSVIYCPVEGSGMPQRMINDLSYIKANGGAIVAQTRYGQERMKSALTNIDIPYIYHGFDDKIYKPLNFRKGPNYDSIRYCYYKTENGKLDVNPVLLYKQGCYDCNKDKEKECLLPNSPILTLERGIQKIKDINVGDKVLTHKGRFRRVSQVINREYSGDMIKITPRKLRIPIILTPNHKVLAIKTERCAVGGELSICKPEKKCYKNIGGREYKICNYISGEEPYRKYKTEWIEARNLKNGDYVIYPKVQENDIDINKLRIIDYIDDFLNVTGDSHVDNSTQFDIFGDPIDKTISMNAPYSRKYSRIPAEIDLNEDLMRLFGYFISEGSVGQSKRGITTVFTLNISEHEYLNDIEVLMKNIFGLKCRHTIIDNDSTHRLEYDNRLIGELFTNLFCPKEYQRKKGKGSKANIVRIPPEFLNLPKNKLVQLIRGIWNGDGTYKEDVYEIATTSETLLWQLVYILSKFNILPSVRMHDYKNDKWSILYNIEITGKDMNIFNDILAENHRNNRKDIAGQYLKGKKFYFTQIKSIDIIKYNADVWNLDVEEDSSYVSVIAVHNCNDYKEEHVSILKFINGKWTEQDIPITDLPIVTMNRFIFGFVGQNLGVRKKIERLLKAYSIFIKDSRQLKDRTLLHLHTMPISVEGIDLIKVIQDLGIQDSVIFSYGNNRSSGWTDEGMNILYNTFDVNVSASSSEGFCLPVLEGFATGLPMIAPNCTAFMELIGEDEKTRRGLLASIIDRDMLRDGTFRDLVSEDNLAHQMKTIYQSEDLRKTFSKSAIRFAENYTWSKICVQWDELLKTI